MIALFVLALSSLSSEAKVTVSAMFTDNMVLQREADVPIWGTAEQGEAVAVEWSGMHFTG